MKAVTFHGAFNLKVEEKDDPTILQPNDAILKVTTAAICGSDMHVYDGRMPLPPTGWILGHEYIGEVVEVGSGITNFKPGDRAVGSFVSACGGCWYCKNDWPSGGGSEVAFGLLALRGGRAGCGGGPSADGGRAGGGGGG